MRRKRARECVPDLEIEFVGTGVPDGPFCRIFKSATCRNFNDMLANEAYVLFINGFICDDLTSVALVVK